ncbi:SPOR domain-containing protein [Succinivibrio sp.]|uniref:SPOR domain-containing protein n=1 Tax=Succinivibrio sp. TaxID=2053619 RepID=UPI0025E811AC|nr:SPOR domain-containing protein [Succinivibrio sp.]MBQ9221218.1 SPOR domain-containing protein [Succinivibrio sp.]
MTDNKETNKKEEKTLSKSLRNRIVGFLVLLSVILIFMPFLMKDDVVAKKNADAIAITPEGAVTDNNGQLVSAGEHDYSDLLDPVDDSVAKTQVQPKADSPFDALKSSKTDNTSGITAADIPDDNMFASSDLEVATPISASSNVTLPSVSNQSPKSETLKSSHANVPAATPNVKTPKEKAPAQKNDSNALASGNYAAQVGVFSKKTGAQQVINQLKSAGFSPVTQNVNINGKPLIKVYAGTSKNRAAVQGICQRVQAKTSIKCMVQTL